MRNPQLLFGFAGFRSRQRSACSLASVPPSMPFTPMSMIQRNYSTNGRDWQYQRDLRYSYQGCATRSSTLGSRSQRGSGSAWPSPRSILVPSS